MSALSRALANRSVAAPATPGVITSLADLPIRRSGTIIGISGDIDPAVARRLADLGFAPNQPVTPIRRSALGDPRVYAVADCEIVLRKEQARAIEIGELR